MSIVTKKKKERIIIAILVVCILIVIRLLHGPFIKEVRDFELSQNNMAIDVTWTAEKKSANWIFFRDEDFFPDIMRGKGGKKTIPVDKVPGKYKVSILSFDGFGFPRYSKKTIKLVKLEQSIELPGWTGEYIKGDKRILKAKAIAETKFTSSNRKVANVTPDGELECKRPGTAVITITAPEGDYYKAAERKETIRVLPKSLNTPRIKRKNKGARTMIKCGKVAYADRYILYKYDRVSGKYKKLSTVPAKKRQFIVPNEVSDYQVRANRTVKGQKVRTITSELTDPVHISSPAETASSYKSINVIKSLDADDFRKVVKVKEFGSAVVPQSFCMVGKDYYTAVSSRRGTDSVIVHYNAKGKQKSVKAADIGYGNGSTYNPLTETIYTVKSHGNNKSDVCTAIDLGAGFVVSSFELPRTASGIAYDITNNRYYLSAGENLMVTDNNFRKVKSFKKLRYKTAQDIGGHDGVILVTVWDGGKYSHIDMYRQSDKAYIGTYDLSVGEIESVTVSDKHLVILVHNSIFGGKAGSYILMSKKALTLP